METISQRELRNNSGEVLRRIAAGESLLVTNRGEPAALLSPASGGITRQALIARGLLKPARRRLDLSGLPTVRSTVPTQELLDIDRGAD